MTTAQGTGYRFPAFVTTEEQRKGPALSRPGPARLTHGLSPEQIAFFWANGYVKLPGLFTPDEVKRMSDAGDAIYRGGHVNEKNIRYDFTKIGERSVLWKVDPFFDLHPVFRSAVFDRRILDPIASIYEGREPRLFKDKLIYKPARSHGNVLHQDYNWWQGYPTSLISAAVAIDACTEQNGCTVVYPRDPRLGFVGEPGSFDGTKALKLDPACAPERAVKHVAGPGDVLIFHCFTPHEAGPNDSDGCRRQLFLSYNDSADGEFYFSHADHYRRYYLASRSNPEAYFFA